MSESVYNSGRLPPQGIRDLLRANQRIQQEARGQLPETLVQCTLRSAVRLARRLPGATLTPTVFNLVRTMLHELALREKNEISSAKQTCDLSVCCQTKVLREEG